MTLPAAPLAAGCAAAELASGRGKARLTVIDREGRGPAQHLEKHLASQAVRERPNQASECGRVDRGSSRGAECLKFLEQAASGRRLPPHPTPCRCWPRERDQGPRSVSGRWSYQPAEGRARSGQVAEGRAA
eukprot:scaffold7418_cov31-Tisochrysis_lutea.AAC.6